MPFIYNIYIHWNKQAKLITPFIIPKTNLYLLALNCKDTFGPLECRERLVKYVSLQCWPRFTCTISRDQFRSFHIFYIVNV